MKFNSYIGNDGQFRNEKSKMGKKGHFRKQAFFGKISVR